MEILYLNRKQVCNSWPGFRIVVICSIGFFLKIKKKIEGLKTESKRIEQCKVIDHQTEYHQRGRWNSWPLNSIRSLINK